MTTQHDQDESHDERALTVMPALRREFSADEVEALRKTIAKDCNAPQLSVFIMACQRLGLDPFARQITPIVQGDRMTPQVTIDGFRLVAERTRKYAGQIGPFWCGKDGMWREVWTEDEPPVAARMGVIRRDFAEPLFDVAHMRSYNKGSATWKQLPIEMLAKVAEARALRRAFPQELSGVYTDDEMAQSSAPTAYIETELTSGPTAQDVKREDADERVLKALHRQDVLTELTRAGYRETVSRYDCVYTIFQRFDRDNIEATPRNLIAALHGLQAATPASLEELPVGTRGN